MIGNRLRSLKLNAFRRVVEAVEKTSVDASKHAKQGHNSNLAHMGDRYQNQTTNLTRSIHPFLENVCPTIFRGGIATDQKYAIFVETKYPYFLPALNFVEPIFKERLRKVLR